MRTPVEVYLPSSRSYGSAAADLSYQGMLERRIHKLGHISLEGRRMQISAALAGWTVGLRPLSPDRYELPFARLRLGEVELSTRTKTS